MFYVEGSDSMNMESGSNSLMGELSVLLGVMTGGISLILNFWFQRDSENGGGELPSPPAPTAGPQAEPSKSPAPVPPSPPTPEQEFSEGDDEPEGKAREPKPESEYLEEAGTDQNEETDDVPPSFSPAPEQPPPWPNP